MEYRFLNRINSPSDLKNVNDKDIPLLAEEIREFLIGVSARRGGHLASNLGVVELTLAIHKVFDSPKDHIIFDVGHQSYVHKIITGRRERFEDLRKPGGLSGFTLRKESVHDSFGAGHSSTSVSAALGFAESDLLKKEKAFTVCVLGDGAYTGGMVHEALNNCKPDLPLVIILNENGMSISKNHGTFANYISRVRSSGRYISLKKGTNNFLSKIPLIGKPCRKLITAVKNGIKRIVYTPNYFEELGLYYMGPIDGNDYEKTLHALQTAKKLNRTVVLHLKTVKGKGYNKAENHPEGFHSVSNKSVEHTFHSVFAEELMALAEKEPRILAVTAAMGIGTGLDRFGEKYPERYFDVGIAESHALTFSAALAANGFMPFAALYSTFLQRGYDNIIHDVALQNLPVKIMIDRAGLAMGDGATHHGIFDVSFLCSIPKMVVFAPSGYESLKREMNYSLASAFPVAIRYSNSSEVCEDISGFVRIGDDFSPLIDFDVNDPPKYLFITYGSLLSRVREAKAMLESRGFVAGIMLIEKIKPLSGVSDLIFNLSPKVKTILFAEEGIKQGGVASALLHELKEGNLDFEKTDYRISAIDDNFASPDKICDLYESVGLSPNKLAERMLEI